MKMALPIWTSHQNLQGHVLSEWKELLILEKESLLKLQKPGWEQQ